MIKEERFERIRSELAKRGTVQSEELSELLGISRATVRRDLEAMEGLGMLRRTRGGATVATPSDELPFHTKLAAYLPEKRAIGALVASLIPDKAVIGCSGGTTVMNVIKALQKKQLTILTNAVNVAMELAPFDSAQVIVTGGVLSARTYELVGHIADRTIEGFHLDIALLGVDGISFDYGLSTYTIADAHTDSLYMNHATETWVVADHSKFGKVAPALIAPIGSVKRIVSDSGLSAADRHALEAAGVEVIIAEL
jgi:DeoR/GlpR family transcriptional regulator of sugar metabolism